MNIMVNFTGSEDTMDARPTSIGVLRPYEAVIIQSRAEH